MNKVTLINVKTKKSHDLVDLPTLCLELCGGGLTTQQTAKAMLMQQDFQLGAVIKDLQLAEVYFAMQEVANELN